MVTFLMVPSLAFAADGDEADGEESGDEAEESSSIAETEDVNKSYTSYTGDTVYMCLGGQYDNYNLLYDAQDEDGDTNEETELVKTKVAEFEDQYANSLSEGGSTSDDCGKNPMSLTGSLELATCADEGKVVTEISESFAGSTELTGEDGSLEAYVVDVYRATCCLIVEENYFETDDEPQYTYECKDYRNLYYTSMETCTSTNDWSCERRQWIIGESGASIIKIYVKQIYMWAAGTIGFIAVVTIVLNGIRITVSGVSGDVTQAKERILQAISGLVLLFLSGLILYTINPTFFS